MWGRETWVRGCTRRGVLDFSPFAVGYVRREIVPVNLMPRFPGDAAANLPPYTQGTEIESATLPAATGDDGALRYTLTGPDGANLPEGLNYTPPTVEEPHGGTLRGTPTEAQPAIPYTLMATDAVDVTGVRFVQQPGGVTATVGGQALSLRRDGDTARWRQAAGVAYG